METVHGTTENARTQSTNTSADDETKKDEKNEKSKEEKSSKSSKTRDYGELCMALVTEDDDGTRTFVVPTDQPEFSRIREVEDYIKEAVTQSDQKEFHAAVLRIKRDYKVTKEVQTKVSFSDVS